MKFENPPGTIPTKYIDGEAWIRWHDAQRLGHAFKVSDEMRLQAAAIAFQGIIVKGKVEGEVAVKAAVNAVEMLIKELKGRGM